MLTYVANMGVLVSSGDTKVLIDGLFDAANSHTRVPAPETFESIMRGEPPFDGVDLVLVTHKDRDHFSAALAVRYLETRPEPILVAPSDAVEAIRKIASNWPRIASRIIPIDLEVRESAKKEVAHIPLTIIRTTHGTTPWPMNHMYLIDFNGWRIFHEGDASGRPDDYRGLGLESAPVDLAVVQYYWPIHPHPPYRGFLLKLLKPDHIALGHLNIREESVAEGKVDEIRRNYKDIFVLLPGMPARVFRK
ncbi:MAG: MBL fold metallo-hydrolase [Candidatus Aminicenantes bacterium]|nr:MBL fold metallo-hydrolase [Candidatus Aminicenantes bacterium]